MPKYECKKWYLTIVICCFYTVCSPALESVKCKAMPGHYYDMLLKKCVNCSAVCGRHPVECSAHCQSEYCPQ